MNAEHCVLIVFQLIWKEKSKGRRNELRATAAFKGSFNDVPCWFQSIENATPLQDRAGIDVVVHTDIGRIYVQIKSCRRKAEVFKQDQAKGRYAKNIEVVVIREDYTPEEVREVILSVVIPAYRKIVGQIAAKHGARFIPATAA